MQEHFFKSIKSTQLHLYELLKTNQVEQAVISFNQSGGIGSRENAWEGKEGNIYFSFALKKDSLASDLPLQSVSIYFAMLFKQLLAKKGSKIWLKWPNDFYLKDKKIGGLISCVKADMLVVGIGLNVAWAPKGALKLDIEVDKLGLIREYLKLDFKNTSWKKIFSNFVVEFDKGLEFYTHDSEEKIKLLNATLNNDGSISIDERRIYSRR